MWWVGGMSGVYNTLKSVSERTPPWVVFAVFSCLFSCIYVVLSLLMSLSLLCLFCLLCVWWCWWTVCWMRLLCAFMCWLKEIVLLWVWVGFLFPSTCIVLHSVCVFCLWSHLLFRCSFHMFVLCCCMREVNSRFKPFSVGSHGLLLRVVSLRVIFCLMCSSKSLHVLWILPFEMWCLSACWIMLVRMLLAVCGSVSVVVNEGKLFLCLLCTGHYDMYYAMYYAIYYVMYYILCCILCYVICYVLYTMLCTNQCRIVCLRMTTTYRVLS